MLKNMPTNQSPDETPLDLRIDNGHFLFMMEIKRVANECLQEHEWGDALAYLVCRNITIVRGDEFKILSIAPDQHKAEVMVPHMTTRVMIRRFVHEYVREAIRLRRDNPHFSRTAEQIDTNALEEWLRSRELPDTAEELTRYYQRVWRQWITRCQVGGFIPCPPTQKTS